MIVIKTNADYSVFGFYLIYRIFVKPYKNKIL